MDSSRESGELSEGEIKGDIEEGELKNEKEQSSGQVSQQSYRHFKSNLRQDESSEDSSSHSSKASALKMFKVGKQIISKGKRKRNKKAASKRKQVNQEENSSSSSQSYTSSSKAVPEEITHYLRYDLCKYFMANNCQRAEIHGNYSHHAKQFPCKWIHSTGVCDKGEHCRFSHNILNEKELIKFMKENFNFLDELYLKKGETNLGVFWTRFRDEQLKVKAGPQMIPPPPQIQQMVQQQTPNNVMANYQKAVQSVVPQQPPILQAPQQPQMAPQSPQNQQAALIQLNLVMTQQQQTNLIQQQNQTKQNIDMLGQQNYQLHQQMIQVGQFPNQQPLVQNIQSQMQNNNIQIQQLQQKLQDITNQIANLQIQQAQAQQKLQEAQNAQMLQPPQMQFHPLPTQPPPQMQFHALPTTPKQMLHPQPPMQMQPIHTVPTTPPPVQQQPLLFNMPHQQPVAAPPPVQQQPPQFDRGLQLGAQQQQMVEQKKPETAGQGNQLNGLVNLLGQLKHQAEQKLEQAIQKQPPKTNQAQALKKIEADLIALSNNQKFPTLSATQLKVLRPQPGKGLCSSSSSSNANSQDSVDNLPPLRMTKQKQQSSRKQQKCLFNEKRCFKDYDSHSLSECSFDSLESLDTKVTLTQFIYQS